MSKITQEKLLAGIIFGDNDNEEYIYLRRRGWQRSASLRAGTRRQPRGPAS